MADRPILFSAPMIRALLAGTKTQTRRVVKPQPSPELMTDYANIRATRGSTRTDAQMLTECLPCPYGEPGSKLWVRETWMDLQGSGVEHRDSAGQRQRYAYAADTPPGSYGDECRKDFGLKWRPSIHMPRAASRITLEITGVRVERLQDISEADAVAEGTPCYVCGGPLNGSSEDDCHCFHRRASPSDYRGLWESINGPGSWDANPFVWVLEFRRAASAQGEKE